MIRSMTAYARAAETTAQGEMVWQIRSVNHRYLETSVRLPEELRDLEPVVREKVAATLGRGKVEVGLRYVPSAQAASELAINDRLVDQLIKAADQMVHKLHSSGTPSIMDLMRWPGVLEAKEQDFGPVQKQAAEVLDKALVDLVEAREREGQRLAELIENRLAGMREQVSLARTRMPEVIEGVRQRLRNRLQEVSETLDAERLEQEMALLAQRLDVDEEMDRLDTHLAEVQRVLGTDEPVGRRLDFLMQELNREANTLGSKSADSETTAISVEMKVLIEQMREQVQNLE